ncbi:hypothetical protein ACFZCY_41250 [Streptomyces sp. NPDC007983]|uniref:hypothetical protein n=1 Tax=Streptomyces sp. NPDC007983 TaxID=3364800 RepID=UPI0036F0580F
MTPFTGQVVVLDTTPLLVKVLAMAAPHLALPVPFSEASGSPVAQQTVVETLQEEGGIATGAVLAEHAAAMSGSGCVGDTRSVAGQHTA